jgi:hypothetical protein
LAPIDGSVLMQLAGTVIVLILAMGKTHCPQGFSQPACKNVLPLCILTCRCLLEAVRKETNT